MEEVAKVEVAGGAGGGGGVIRTAELLNESSASLSAAL